MLAGVRVPSCQGRFMSCSIAWARRWCAWRACASVSPCVSCVLWTMSASDTIRDYPQHTSQCLTCCGWWAVCVAAGFKPLTAAVYYQTQVEGYTDSVCVSVCERDRETERESVCESELQLVTGRINQRHRLSSDERRVWEGVECIPAPHTHKAICTCLAQANRVLAQANRVLAQANRVPRSSQQSPRSSQQS